MVHGENYKLYSTGMNLSANPVPDLTVHDVALCMHANEIINVLKIKS